MTLQEAKDIIQKEDLERWAIWFDDNRKEDAAGIRKKDDGWEVYLTIERASEVRASFHYFDRLEDALDFFIDLVRMQKSRFLRYWNSRPQRH